MEQNRFSSPVLWMGIIAEIINIIGLVGGWDALGISSDVFKGIATSILTMLTLIGVLNNPTDRQGW